MSQNHFQYAKWHACTAAADIVVPEVMQWLAPRSVLDVGCGTGNWLSTFVRHGVEEYLGLDLSEHQSDFFVDAQHFRQTDLNQPFDLGHRFDLVMSLEVAEHLHAESGPHFVESLVRHSDTILFSAAIPHQKGTNHINTRWHEYWVGLFCDHGLKPDLTLRNLFWNDSRISWWYRQNIFLFSRRPLAMPVSPQPLNVVHPDHYLSVVQRLHKEQEQRYQMNGIRRSGQVFLNNIKRRVTGRSSM